MIVYEFMMRQGLSKVTRLDDNLSCIKAEMFGLVADEMAKVQTEEMKRRRK